jgi:acyl-CoA reductase-like NAD-dependent aldehyde dehydrogenase
MVSTTLTPPKVRIGQTRLLINGEWQDAADGKTFETINPANEQVIAKVAEAAKPDVDRAVAAARRSFDGGPWSRTRKSWPSSRRSTTASR